MSYFRISSPDPVRTVRLSARAMGRKKLHQNLVKCVKQFLISSREKGDYSTCHASDDRYIQRHRDWVKWLFSTFAAKSYPREKVYFEFMFKNFPGVENAFLNGLAPELACAPSRWDAPAKKTATKIIDSMGKNAVEENNTLYRSYTNSFIKERYPAAKKTSSSQPKRTTTRRMRRQIVVNGERSAKRFNRFRKTNFRTPNVKVVKLFK